MREAVVERSSLYSLLEKSLTTLLRVFTHTPVSRRALRRPRLGCETGTYSRHFGPCALVARTVPKLSAAVSGASRAARYSAANFASRPRPRLRTALPLPNLHAAARGPVPTAPGSAPHRKPDKHGRHAAIAFIQRIASVLSGTPLRRGRSGRAQPGGRAQAVAPGPHARQGACGAPSGPCQRDPWRGTRTVICRR